MLHTFFAHTQTSRIENKRRSDQTMNTKEERYPTEAAAKQTKIRLTPQAFKTFNFCAAFCYCLIGAFAFSANFSILLESINRLPNIHRQTHETKPDSHRCVFATVRNGKRIYNIKNEQQRTLDFVQKKFFFSFRKQRTAEFLFIACYCSQKHSVCKNHSIICTLPNTCLRQYTKLIAIR